MSKKIEFLKKYVNTPSPIGIKLLDSIIEK